MNATRIAAATLLVTLIAAASPARSEESLHESLRALQPWLGTWRLDGETGAPLRAEYRAVLGGRFVETRHRDASSGELLAHSMIAAAGQDGALIEYRFDSDGNLSERPFEAGNRHRGTPVVDAREDTFDVNLDASLATLHPFLGQWEVVTDWLDGGVMWAQMTNRAELDGHVISTRVLAAESGEPPYDRFRTFYYRDGGGDLRELTFTHTGKVVNEKLLTNPAEQKISLLTIYKPDTIAPIGIRKRLTVSSQQRMLWSDDFRAQGADEWERVIDAEWVRVGPADPRQRRMPVDDTLFAPAGTDVRAITVERAVDAAPDAVWDAWTTEAGWKAAYAPGRDEPRARIELAPGGRYEWLFDGMLGCNGCQVLSYLPPRMLSFTWNSPVTQPGTRLQRTWVVIELEAADDSKTRVRLTQLGFGDGPHWDETRAYFAQAWAFVLEQMAQNLGH